MLDPLWRTYAAHITSHTANLKVLNHLRESRGFNTLALKPHAGEAGMRHHLATTFLCADSVNHGIKLKENPTLHYLYYLAQIGLAMCPTSNHALFLKLEDSPIGDFFRQGLNVSLGTDDPLQFHQVRKSHALAMPGNLLAVIALSLCPPLSWGAAEPCSVPGIIVFAPGN